MGLAKVFLPQAIAQIDDSMPFTLILCGIANQKKKICFTAFQKGMSKVIGILLLVGR